jgi:hypothetical protein
MILSVESKKGGALFLFRDKIFFYHPSPGWLFPVLFSWTEVPEQIKRSGTDVLVRYGTADR